MKIARALGIAAIVVVALLVGAAIYLVATFDSARIKREAVAAVKEKTGRNLVIAGDLGLSFWPSLGVNIEKASLSERDGKESFAAFDSAHVSVRVMPLLSKQVVVDRISLEGLLLILKRDREGRLNIDDLLQQDATPSEKDDRAAARAKRAQRFDIAGISVSNSRVEWHDQQARRDIVLSPLDFEAGRTTKEGENIGVRDVKLAMRGKLDADSVEVKLDLPRIERHSEKLEVDKIDLHVSLKGAQRTAEVDATMDGIAGSLQELAGKRFSFDASATLNGKTFDTKLQSPVRIGLDAGSVELPQLAGTFGIDMPGLPKRPMQLPIEARIVAHYREPDVSGNVKTAFDDTKASASFDVGPFSPLNVALDLDVDKLDLDRYLPAQKTPAVKADKPSSPAPAAAEAPIDLSALKGLNARGSVRIGALQVKRLKARNVRINFKSANGRLTLSPHSADFYGGRLAGSAALDAEGNAVALNETLTNIDIGPLVKDLADKNPLDGRGDVAVDVNAQGATAGEMKKSLAGRATLNLRDGAIKGINLARTLRDAKARLHGDEVTQEASTSDKTDFSELRASFKVANGVAHNEDLAAKSPFLRIGGKGDVDVGNSRLDYLLLASVVSTSAGQGGKELDALKGVTVPVRISGPFEKPTFKLDVANLVNDAARARVEEKRDEAKQKLQENLKGRLKGLFDK